MGTGVLIGEQGDPIAGLRLPEHVAHVHGPLAQRGLAEVGAVAFDQRRELRVVGVARGGLDGITVPQQPAAEDLPIAEMAGEHKAAGAGGPLRVGAFAPFHFDDHFVDESGIVLAGEELHNHPRKVTVHAVQRFFAPRFVLFGERGFERVEHQTPADGDEGENASEEAVERASAPVGVSERFAQELDGRNGKAHFTCGRS